MKVTIRDVATRCGVSVATVSRVINNSDQVTAETKKKVLKVIEELGFIPNTNARGLSTKSTNTIGIIVPNVSNPFFGELIQGAEGAASESGYQIIILNSGYSREKTLRDIMVLQSRDVDGIIMSTADIDEKTLDYLHDNQIPFVLMGPVQYKYPVNYVSVDNMEGARMAVQHLVDLGHERIAYCTEKHDNYLNQLRYEGYIKALSSNGIEVQQDMYFENDVEKNVATMLLEEEGKRPTAIFAFNDNLALSYMEALERKGVRIPEDMAVVGFDNIRFASYYAIQLTTIDNRQEEFGREGFQILREILKNDGKKTQQIITRPQLIVRKSCGAK